MSNRSALPIRFTSENEVKLENTNFHKVKILIMHTGENFNGSVFSNDSINASIHTLSNIPILAYVETNSYGEKDFKGHEIDYDIFEDDNGNLKIKEYYKEMPIGVIPESNEYFTEEIDSETYLGCYGYIWKCYSNDAYDILLEDESKEVSMEILIKECSYDRLNRCNINKFEFLGVTVLGAKVPGAMGVNCELTMDFSTDLDKEYAMFSKTVVELNNYLKGKESVSEVSDELNKDVLEFEEEVKDEEVCSECGQNPCECEEEEFAQEENEDVQEAEFAEEDEEEVCDKCGKNPCECEDEDEEEEFAEKDDEEEEKVVCPDCGVEPCECDKEEEACKKKKKCSIEEFSQEEQETEEEVVEEEQQEETVEQHEEFSISLNNIFKSLRVYLQSYTYEYESFWGDKFQCQKYYVEDLIPQDNVVIIYDCEYDEYYGVTYSYSNDDISCNLDDKKVYIQEWRMKEDGMSKFEKENGEKREAVIYNMIAEEYHALKDFKEEIENAQELALFKSKVDEVLANFNFNEEEISDLIERVYAKSLTLEDFEDKLYALEARKLRKERENFASNNSFENSLNITDDSKEEEIKSQYYDILQKYGLKK